MGVRLDLFATESEPRSVEAGEIIFRAFDMGTEMYVILQVMGGRSEAASERLFRWMTVHYDQVSARIPPFALRFMPGLASGCSEERLMAAKAFWSDPAHAVPGTEQTLDRVSDQVRTCRSLREREGEHATSYMRSFAIN